MRVATLRTGNGTTAVRIDGDTAVEIPGVADVGVLLGDDDWRSRAVEADGTRLALADIADAQWAAVVPRPGKIVCVGLNYKSHILEMGRDLPEYPTLFAKFAEALIGPYDPIVLPANASAAVDWEAELAVIIGRHVYKADQAQAAASIAGYSIINDVSMRDYQFRTNEWLQGKTFEATSPFGPVLVTPDEFGDSQRITCRVDGETMQDSETGDLLFDPAALVSYVSSIVSLSPGDVIATGTPGGVGHARTPARYLAPGMNLETEIAGVGVLRNSVVAGS